MSKTKILLDVVEDLLNLADSLRTLVEISVSDELANEEADATPSNDKKAPAPIITIDQIRSVLAEKSGDGKTAEVKALLYKYDAGKRSGVKPEDYPALLEEAKKL